MNIPVILISVLSGVFGVVIYLVWRADRATWKAQLELAKSNSAALIARLETECARLNKEIVTIETEHDAALKKLGTEWDQKDAQVGAMCAELRALHSARNVAWTKPSRRMPGNEVKRAFALDDTAPIWIALNQELDDYLQDIIDQVSLPPGPTLSEEARTHLAGGIEHVRLLHKRMLELHASARTADTDLEAEKEEATSDV